MATTFEFADENLTGTGANVVYTCPPNTTAIITGATAANVGADARLVTAWLIRSGEAVVDANKVQIDLGVNPDGDAFMDKVVGQTLKAGDTINAALDAAGNVNVFLSLREIV